MNREDARKLTPEQQKEKHTDLIEVFFLPAYSPELNPDEYLNCDLKAQVHGGKPHTVTHNSSSIADCPHMLNPCNKIA